MRPEKHNDSAPSSRFLRILRRWKESIRKPAVPKPHRLAGIRSKSADKMDTSKSAFSTVAEGRSKPRTVRRVAEPKAKRKKSKTRTHADGDRDRSTSTGDRPPNTGPSSDVALTSDVHGDHDCGTTNGRPPHLKPSSKAQAGKDAVQPSTGRIRLIRESENATVAITFPTWLCCYSPGTKEE